MSGLETAMQELTADDELIEFAKGRSVTEQGSSSTGQASSSGGISEGREDIVVESEGEDNEVSPEGDAVSRPRKGRKRTEATQAGQEF